MKKIILLLTLVLSFGYCRADYETTKLPELIENSQLIIECKIVNVLSDEIEVEILDVIKGNTSLKKVLVSKFKNWTCASRWTTYKNGQTELMFLKKSSKIDKWFILGAGNEGEMPIEEGMLYYKNLYMRIDNSPQKLTLNDGVIYGYKFGLIESKNAIKEYLKNAKLINELVTSNKADEYETESLFLIRIIGELKEMKN